MDSSIKVARGILIAATSDDVQPLAILACERFGNTLAMSQMACDCIESKVLPTPAYAPIRFLHALVGYSRDDAATQLGRSQAGIQFLSLAAALISTMGIFRGSKSIWPMLKESARDKHLLPRPTQVQDLLAKLEARCNYAGFMDLALSWQSKLRQKMSELGHSPESTIKSSFYPAPDGLVKLVDAFRQLSRIGDASVTRVSIRTTSCAPWVAAFTEWCLGTLPSIFVDDGGQLHIEPNSKVIITTSTGIGEDTCPGFEVTTHHDLESIKELAVSGIMGPWNGPSSISKYGRWLFQTYGFETSSSSTSSILREVLPSAVHQVLMSLQLSRFKQFDHTVSLDQWPFIEAQPGRPRIDQELQKLRLDPFPGIPAVANVLGLLTDGEILRLHPLEAGTLVLELPQARTHLRELSGTCGCVDCAKLHPINAVSGSGNMFKRCDRQQFIHQLSVVVADVLALSLFYCPEDLQIHFPIPQHSETKNPFKKAVETIIMEGSPTHCEFPEVLNWALALAGHAVSKEIKDMNWVMSCYAGQAVWPTVYDTNIVTKHGFLALSSLRGELTYEGERYKVVKGSDEGFAMMNPRQDIFEVPVLKPDNLLPGLEACWRLKVGDGVLNGSMGLKGMDGRYGYVNISPSIILANLASALLVEDCQHASDAVLASEDRFCSFTGPVNPTQPAYLSKDKNYMKIGVVAVDGADDLRLFSAACGDNIAPIVLRRSACLLCCLDVCRKTRFPVLVL